MMNAKDLLSKCRNREELKLYSIVLSSIGIGRYSPRLYAAAQRGPWHPHRRLLLPSNPGRSGQAVLKEAGKGQRAGKAKVRAEGEGRGSGEVGGIPDRGGKRTDLL